MRNTLRNSWVFIIILFVTFVMPFRVEAKQTNTAIWESEFDNKELISGDTITINEATTFTPVENQNFKFYDEDKITNFEYYIIDSIDSNGDIKYKKYDFTDLNKNVWYPTGSVIYDLSGGVYDKVLENINYFNVCDKNSRHNGFNSFREDYGYCLVILPSVNGKISRWRFGSKDYGDEKDIDVCKFQHKVFSNNYYSSCDKTDEDFRKSYIGTYKYYTSYTYKFYQIPDEKPEVNVICDSNKLSAGETTKCKVKASSKYALSNILFDITSDKLKINNFKINNYWDDDSNQKKDYSKYWTFKELNNGYSINFTYDYLSACSNPYDCRRPNEFEYLFDSSFNENPVVATFEVTSDKNIDDVVSSMKTTNFKYVDKTGENTIPDGKSTLGDKINKIINPNTYRDNYYLVIGILIIGLICFIQMKSKAKSK